MGIFKCYSGGKLVRSVKLKPDETYEFSSLEGTRDRGGVSIDRGFVIYRTKKASGFFKMDKKMIVFLWRGDFSLEA